MLEADAQCTIQKQQKQTTSGKRSTTGRKSAAAKRKKKAQQDSESEEDPDGADEDLELSEEAAPKRARIAPRKRLEPML